MKLKILILSILISIPAFPQNEHHGFLYKTKPDVDCWSIAHIGKGAFFYSTFRCLKLKPAMALILTGVMAYITEIVIDGYQNKVFGIDPDPGGADLIGDPIFNVLGGCIALITEKHLKTRRIRPWGSGGRIGIEFDL